MYSSIALNFLISSLCRAILQPFLAGKRTPKIWVEGGFYMCMVALVFVRTMSLRAPAVCIYRPTSMIVYVLIKNIIYMYMIARVLPYIIITFMPATSNACQHM
jgi:hypothetical protein